MNIAAGNNSIDKNSSWRVAQIPKYDLTQNYEGPRQNENYSNGHNAPVPKEYNDRLTIGPKGIVEVTILNDDDPGELRFDKRGYLLKESCGTADIGVERKNGVDGNVSVKWRVHQKSTKTDEDEVDALGTSTKDGVISFKHGEIYKMISIPIKNEYKFDKKAKLEVELYEPNGGATLGKVTKTIINISSDDESFSILHRTLLKSHVDVEGMRVDSGTWGQQLKDAMNVNGGDIENATTMDYIMHFLTFGFKMIFESFEFTEPSSICLWSSRSITRPFLPHRILNHCLSAA